MVDGDLIRVRGEAVRGLRRRAGLSQLEVAGLSGLAQDYVSKIEAGRIKSVAPHRLSALADALGVDPVELRARPLAVDRADAADERLVARIAHEVAERIAARVGPEVAAVVRAIMAEGWSNGHQQTSERGDVPLVSTDKGALGRRRLIDPRAAVAS
jgi:transcriptional regulator with XRE-family HTH domain